MKKIIASLHVSLDGFLAGPNGEMDWITINEELFNFVKTLTQEADTALYGRVTYDMMEQYWPTAAQQTNATKHDIEHSKWYSQVDKIVLSRKMKDMNKDKTRFISKNISEEIEKLKQQPGKNILIFGSPSAIHTLMEFKLIDEFWLFVNPVLLGEGIPVFAHIKERIPLKRLETKVLDCGVTGLNYILER